MRLGMVIKSDSQISLVECDLSDVVTFCNIETKEILVLYLNISNLLGYQFNRMVKL